MPDLLPCEALIDVLAAQHASSQPSPQSAMLSERTLASHPLVKHPLFPFRVLMRGVCGVASQSAVLSERTFINNWRNVAVFWLRLGMVSDRRDGMCADGRRQPALKRVGHSGRTSTAQES